MVPLSSRANYCFSLEKCAVYKLDATFDQPIEKDMLPGKAQVHCALTTWGLQHEPDAIRAYVKEMMKKHMCFQHFRPGVYLSTLYPYLAATPDAVVMRECCGKGVAEVSLHSCW